MESNERESLEQLMDNTIRSNRLEDENLELKNQLSLLTNLVLQTSDEISTLFHGPKTKACRTCENETQAIKLNLCLDTLRRQVQQYKYLGIEPMTSETSSAVHKSAQLQVKVEMEVERRKRVQDALDDAEKRYFAANRALEKKELECAKLTEQLKVIEKEKELELDGLRKENEALQAKINDKERKIKESLLVTKDLTSKADQFQELFNEQLEVVKKLQTDLNVAYDENKGLVKEMELLNEMFKEMEQTHVNDALIEYQQSEVDLSDAKHQDSKGKVVGVEEILKAVSDEQQRSSIQDSCFKEVTTKNGTRMVLSVSKTFMKLKDLILEKKTLEDQMEKMKTINNQLSSKVNTHEAKLFNITDELNKTWNYVSTIKLQHKKLHTSEQILRAELLEKRQLLNKLREELEYSRQNWLLVKQKTAESEMEWNALKEEFRKRKSELNSSESGYSDGQTEEESEQSPKLEVSKPASETNANPNDIQTKGEEEEEEVVSNENVPLVAVPVFVPSLEYMTQVPSEMMPPLFPEHCKEESGEYQDIYNKLIASTTRSAILANRLAEVNRSLGQEDSVSVVSTTDVDEDDDVEPRTEDDSEGINVESPDLISDDQDNASEYDTASQADEDDEDTDVSLECPFPEGFQPSSRLQDLPSAQSSSNNNSSPMQSPAIWNEDTADEEEDDDEDDEDDETESLVLKEDDSDDFSLECPFPEDYEPSPRLQALPSAQTSPSNEDDTRPMESPALWDQTDEEDLNDDNEEEALSVLDAGERTETPSSAIPTPPPPPPFSLLPPSVSNLTSSRSLDLGLYADLDSDSDDEDNGNRHDNAEEQENSTNVTRFLIKYLPKQMAKLRNDKSELEDKIQDLEARVSQQNQAMLEMERRMELTKREADKLKAKTKVVSSTTENGAGGISDSSNCLEIPLSFPGTNNAIRLKFMGKISKNTTVRIFKSESEILFDKIVLEDDQEIYFQLPQLARDVILKISSTEKISNLKLSIDSGKFT